MVEYPPGNICPGGFFMSFLARFRELEEQGIDILAILAGDRYIDDVQLEAITQNLGPLGQDYHVDLIELITHERHDPERSRDLWKGICQHKREMEQSLGRKVGVRVAAADYLIHDRQVLDAPRLVSRGLMERLVSQVSRDPLTRLHNRRHLDEILRREIHRVRRYGGRFTVLLVDLDHFKEVNDCHGHVAGDTVLQEVSVRLERAVRETDTVGRWGGDEWLLILPETVPEDARVLSRRLRSDVREKAVTLGDSTELSMTVSVGIAGYPESGRTIQDLLGKASEELRKAKSSGRDAESFSVDADITDRQSTREISEVPDRFFDEDESGN
ncbi:MAG TPA: hypothetical protein DGU45_03895 [Planctomycetes bacterium]|nr:hypothetical protein [Planctomycetota bacterium]